MLITEIILFVFFACVLIVITVMVNLFHVKKKKRLQYIEGLKWLKNLRLLLSLIQQHRGLTMGHINGDDSLTNRITTIKQNINRKISQINAHQSWISHNQIWPGITDHWSRLANNYLTYDSQYNYTQHCNMVTNLLHLIEECAENHHLQELRCDEKQPANILWDKLLVNVENIGQARAVGTSIAAAKTSTSVERIKMNYLQNCIKKSLLESEQTFDVSLINQLIRSINQEVIIEKPSIEAEVFFDLATDGIDILLAQFDLYLDKLHHSAQMS